MSTSLPLGAVRDPAIAERLEDSVAPVLVDVGDFGVFEEHVGMDRFGKDAKYAYAIARAPTKILRVKRPTLGWRK